MADILITLIMKIIGKHFLRLALLLAVLPLKAQQPKQGMVIPLTADAASTLTVYLPDQPSGRAVVALPGGGYTHLAINKEGHDWAPFFNQRGIAFFVLKYRMPHGNPSLPVDDAEKAIRMVRDSALSWHINPYDVGVMGFSAGGHLASVVPRGPLLKRVLTSLCCSIPSFRSTERPLIRSRPASFLETK